MREKCEAELHQKTQRDEEKRFAEERAMQEKSHETSKERAAILIQALWRGWVVRHHKSQKSTTRRGVAPGKSKANK
jgi:IQ calmodulin-binding motif